MAVIAIASETGSEGTAIAQHVARRLGLSLLDHSNILERLAGNGCTVVDLSTGGSAAENNWQLHKIGKIIASEILFLAQKNSMMLHSPYAPHVLAGISHILRIHVRTPAVQRAKNVAKAKGYSESEAYRQISRTEAQSDHLLANCFGVEFPGRADLFDLVADTGWLSAQDWSEQIVDLAQDPDFLPTAASRAKLQERASQAAVASSLDRCNANPCSPGTDG